MRKIAAFIFIFGAFHAPLQCSSIIKPITDYLAKDYGTTPLDNVHQQQVRSIMKEMGITKSIDLRKSNWKAKAVFGRNNAFALYDRYLYLSDSFFDELSKEEQRFLIGHELSHLKYNHIPIRLGFSFFLWILAMFLFWNVSRKIREKISRRSITIPLRIGSAFLLGFGMNVCNATLSRIHERQADVESARCLDCSQGGIEFFCRLEKSATILTPQYDYSTKFKRLVASHPSNDERKQYINELNNKG